MLAVTREPDVALIVEVDGALPRSDSAWEGLAQTFAQNPLRGISVLGRLFQGREAFASAVSKAAPPGQSGLWLDRGVVNLIDRAAADGRPVVLVSHAGDPHLSALAQRLRATAVTELPNGLRAGSDDFSRIRERYPTYDYVAGDIRDPDLWREARRAIAVDLDGLDGQQARLLRPDMELLRRPGWTPGAILRTLRPHQWVKNTLLFIPAIAAHLPAFTETLPTLILGFVAFCSLASGTYVLNDLADLPNDRAHPSKRDRPIPAGELSVPRALLLAVVLFAFTGILSLFLPVEFSLILAVYLVLTVAYSFSLKKRPILDVITLATLYAVRLVGGAALAAVTLSHWFLAFSVFFFFSLALLKRVVELVRRSESEPRRVPGRGYRTGDVHALTSLGTTAAMASALVYCLYIADSEIGELYSRPDLLWLGLPILLFWQSRLWLFASRGAVHDDPVVYALKDRVSQVLLVVFLLVVWIAA